MGLLITQTDIQIVAIERRLGELWFLAGHSINGLAHWIISDDHDLIRFEQKQKMGNMPQKPPSKPSVPLKRPAPTVIRKVPNAIPSITSGIAKLKSAMKSGNDAEAGQILRQLWRAFPQVVESPYGYRMRQKNFNGLRWPSDPAPRIVKEPDEDEKRRRLRGGLATFETSTRKKTSKAVSDSVWKVLAAEPAAPARVPRQPE